MITRFGACFSDAVFFCKFCHVFGACLIIFSFSIHYTEFLGLTDSWYILRILFIIWIMFLSGDLILDMYFIEIAETVTIKFGMDGVMSSLELD